MCCIDRLKPQRLLPPGTNCVQSNLTGPPPDQGMILMRMKLPIGRLSAIGKSWRGTAVGNGSRKADLCRTSIVSNDGFRKNWEPPESAVTYRSVGAIRPSATCAQGTFPGTASVLSDAYHVDDRKQREPTHCGLLPKEPEGPLFGVAGTS